MGSSKKVTTGYWYSLGWHSVLCQGGADAILQMEYGDREFWSGTVTANQTININKPELFGGEKREGGLVGNIDLMFGGDTQEVNTYLAFNSNRTIIPFHINNFLTAGMAAGWAAYLASLGTPPNSDIVANGGIPVPAYRGVVSLVFKSFTFAAMNPYMKPLSVRVRRIPKSLSATNATITIDGRQHANPSHMIYDVLTNTQWGLGYNIDDVDVTSFTSAAATFFNENFGLSIAWTNEGTAEEFINLIKEHANAALYNAPDTGKFTLKPIRADYVIADLPTLGPNNILALRSFQRAAPTDLVNEVTVQYHDPDQDKDAKITVQNLAAIRSVGRIVRRVISMPAIRDASLAARVAERELRTLSTPLASVSLEANLTTWNLRPGGLFKLYWPRLGIESVVFRIIDMEYGDLRSGRITINAIEDVFAMPSSSYVATIPPVWTPVPNDIGDIATYKLLEWPYYLLVRAFGEDYVPNLADERNFTGALAARGNGTWTGFQIHESVGGVYQYNTSSTFAPWFTLKTAVTRNPGDSTWTYEFFIDEEEVAVGAIGLVDEEWVELLTINKTTKIITVKRAVFDSVPATHAIGARIWWNVADIEFDDTNSRFEGENVTYKLLPQAGSQLLPLASATSRILPIVGRQERPYPPGNTIINGEYFPSQVIDDIAVTWAHRDRTQQTASPIAWTTGNIGPETGVTYTAQFYRSTDSTLLHQQTGITTPSKTVGETEIGQESDIRLEISSVRGVLGSVQKLIHTFTRIVTTDPYSLRVFADAPLAFWRLGEVSGTAIKDVSGNARNGTSQGVVTLGAAGLLIPESVNKAISFAGGSYVDVPYVAALAPTVALTVEAWIKVSAWPTGGGYSEIVSKVENGGYAIELYAGDSSLRFYVRRNGAYGYAAHPWSNLSLNTTYHVIGTFDGRYSRIYIDGVLVATDDAGATYPIQYTYNNSLNIGADPGTGSGTTGFYFNGTIDEVSVYGTAIAASEALARYKIGVNRYEEREDPFWDKVVLLMHMEGVNASTTFTDVKGKAVTPNGNAQISTARSKFGNASALFDASGDYLSIPHSTDFSITGDFTIEAWVFTATVGAPKYIARKGSGASFTTGFAFGINASTQPFLSVGISSTDQVVTANVSLSANVWTHVAATKRGSALRIFVDGVLRGTASITGTPTDNTDALIIARDPANAPARDWNGNIDELRITRACRYTKAFSVPSEAFPEQSVVAESVDPYWSSTASVGASVLMHMDGTNGSTAFTDETGKTVTVSGDAQISTAQSKFGGSSAIFDATGDGLSVPHSVDLNLVSGDFTVEVWIYPTTSGGGHFVSKDGRGGISYPQYGLYRTSAGAIQALLGSGTGTSSLQTISSAAGAAAINTWSHVVLSRQDSKIRLFVNGTMTEVNQTATMIDAGLALNIGFETGQPDRFVGYIDELRIIRGAVYTAAFTPPVAALVTPLTLPAVKKTVLLLHMNGTNGSTTFTDQKGKTITPVGNVQISTAQSKFDGASALFDGNGDYLTIPYSSDFALTGDYTIECWVRPTVLTNDTPLFAICESNITGFASMSLYVNANGSVGANVRAVTSGSQTSFLTPAGSLVTGSWQHVVLTRAAGVGRIFVNGVLKASGTLATLTDPDASFVGIGVFPNGYSSTTQAFNGHIDELRVTKGVARYLTSFAPPKLPYADA